MQKRGCILISYMLFCHREKKEEEGGRKGLKGKRIVAGILATMLLGTTVWAAAPYDIQRHWSGDAVNTLMEHDVVHGYPNGRYYPDKSITREEAAQLLALLIQEIEKETPPPSEEVTPSPAPSEEVTPSPAPTEEVTPSPIVFPDVEEGCWSKDSIDFLVERGSITGYPDGTFRPEASVTKAEYAVMIYRYLVGAEGEGKDYNPVFPDVKDGFAYEAIYYLYEHNIITGCPDGTFRPSQPLTRGEAATMLLRLTNWETIPVEVVLPKRTVIDVPYISQLYPVYAVVGCEPTSLLMGLKGKGYALNVGLRQFLDEMPKTTSNPAKGFVGSPYVADKTKKTRTTIYPPILAQYASQYGEVVDFSGKSPEDIQFEVLNGNPVVIYATMRWEKPYYRWYNIEGTMQYLLSNNHAVLICGYDSEQDSYYIADPYNINNTRKEYRYWISASKLEPIYNVRRHAIVVR